ncbi:EamA family transporter [Desulfobotulus sp. H1]|uniref:EamA family transporter n=1 Tax=Desulfobotulus pelophilus TaxID=2823377 RepID=A0ABT3N6A8_9BACT|nr:EamA family transporter [Desulfobotulus pelophilus]MCW7752994.1 EamA family transporter [Desulfobotulus pelophilus]
MIKQPLISRGILLVLVSGILWGTVGIATQSIYQISDIDALTIGFFRLALAFPFVYLFSVVCVKNTRKQICFRDRAKISLLGILLAAYQVLYFAAIAYVGVSIATVITLCSAPVIVALASVFFMKEPLSTNLCLALFLALAGTIFIVGIPDVSLSINRNTPLGMTLAFGSALGYASVTLLGRSLSKDYHPLQTTVIAFGVGATGLLPFASLSSLVVCAPSAESIRLLLYIGLIPSALGYTLFFLGMKTVTASTASILTMVEPLTASVLAWLLLDENIKSSGYFGAALMILAVVSLCVHKESAAGKQTAASRS